MVMQLSVRDREVIRAAWSLGLATADTLRALVAPAVPVSTFRYGLAKLHRAGYLEQVHCPGNRGHLWLYSTTSRGTGLRQPRGWRPGIAQLGHALVVADLLVAAHRRGFARPVCVRGWQGEAELRAWTRPHAPVPSARLGWQCGQARGAWLLELDRVTGSRNGWRRRLLRYVQTDWPAGDRLLIVAATWRRAAVLAELAISGLVPALVTTTAEFTNALDPQVLDPLAVTRHPLSTASQQLSPAVVRGRAGFPG
jgi:hypothetical protein